MKKVVRVTNPSDRLSLDSPKFGMKEGYSKGPIYMPKNDQNLVFLGLFIEIYSQKIKNDQKLPHFSFLVHFRRH